MILAGAVGVRRGGLTTRSLLTRKHFCPPPTHPPPPRSPSHARVVLVLLHDFPEFLSDYHVAFCDVIPTTCIQLRNLVLSAFPRNMRLPDPFTPNLKVRYHIDAGTRQTWGLTFAMASDRMTRQVDMLPEIGQSPRILNTYSKALVAGNFLYVPDNCPPPPVVRAKSSLGRHTSLCVPLPSQVQPGRLPEDTGASNVPGRSAQQTPALPARGRQCRSVRLRSQHVRFSPPPAR